MRDEILAQSLRFRLGQPDPQPPAPQPDDEMARTANPPNTRPIVPLPARANLGGPQPVPMNPRPALRDVTKDLPPAARPSTNLNNNNDDELPHRRKLPGSRQRTSISDTSGGSIFPSARQSTQDTLAHLTQSQPADIPSKSTLAPARSMQSSYFTSAGSSTAASTSDAKAIQASFQLTPTRAPATLVSDSFEGNMLGHTLWSASLRDSPRIDIAQSKDKGKARDVGHETPFVIYEDSKADMSSDFGDTLDPIYLEAFDEVDQHANHPLAPSSQPPIQSEIITIESDEEDEKENAPSAPRHVRRRMGTSPVRSQSTAVEHLGIVEISDSD
ncbi:hypothetical protein BDN71DRAFT_1445984 [Pleurotus eryngii]|uniref:Uncharacterized protein n=1 Tax=Pleurotus eryngii TaxID=5323 RepID=A0A9P5ZYP3_PLEER|nr:hypothetical protein BDN71DRAFT_1445984 [Pleurotus eryngii]